LLHFILIQKISGFKWSHVGVQVGPNLIVHSVFSGIKIESIDKFTKNNEWCKFEKIVEPGYKERAELLLKKKVKYDILGIPLMGLLILVRDFLKIKFNLPLINPKWKVCSETAWFIGWNEEKSATVEDCFERKS
jgi:hypothetical protein